MPTGWMGTILRFFSTLTSFSELPEMILQKGTNALGKSQKYAFLGLKMTSDNSEGIFFVWMMGNTGHKVHKCRTVESVD